MRPADGSYERRTTHDSHDDQEGSHDEYVKETREVRVKLFKVVNKATEEIQAAIREENLCSTRYFVSLW